MRSRERHTLHAAVQGECIGGYVSYATTVSSVVLLLAGICSVFSVVENERWGPFVQKKSKDVNGTACIYNLSIFMQFLKSTSTKVK